MEKNYEIVVPFSALFGSNKFNSLAVRITHTKAGINYFTGKRYEAGHRLSFSPCSVNNGMRSCVLMSGDQWESGFYIMLDNAGRKNPHYIKRAMVAVESVKEDIVRAFEKHDIEVLRSSAVQINQTAAKSPAKPAKAVEVKAPVRSLLTKAVLDKFASVGSQCEEIDPLVVAKFFNAIGAGTWYAIEYNPEEKIFFGYVSLFGGHNDEWGSFSLAELESIPSIQRDRFFTPVKFSKLGLV